MAEEFKEIVIGNIRRDVLLDLMKQGKRFDERGLFDYRKVEIQKNVVPNAEGSALAKIGKTQVLAGVKFDVAKPFADRPEEGVFVTNAELLPLASSTFEPGPPDENSIELARVVDRGIRSAEIIDTKSFFIEKDKVLSLYLDLYVLDHGGNLTDTASLAALAALMNTKVPKVENGEIVRAEFTGQLKIDKLPIATTMGKVGPYMLVDATKEEEQALEMQLTVTTTEEYVCTMQKSKGALTKTELSKAIDLAFEKGKELRKYL